MSEYGSNKSFVLRGIDDTVYEERPVPERQFQTSIQTEKNELCLTFGSRSRRSAAQLDPAMCSSRSRRPVRRLCSHLSGFGKSFSSPSLILVSLSGICGSDVHYLCHGRIGDFVVNSPMVCNSIHLLDLGLNDCSVFRSSVTNPLVSFSKVGCSSIESFTEADAYLFCLRHLTVPFNALLCALKHNPNSELNTTPGSRIQSEASQTR